MNDDVEKGLISILGLWLLFHEVADDLIKNIIKGGEASPEESRNVIEDLAVKVNNEKDAVREYLAEKKIAPLVGEKREETLSKSLETLNFQMEEIKNRLTVMERQLDGFISEG